MYLCTRITIRILEVMVIEVEDRRQYLTALINIMMAIHPNPDKVKLLPRELTYLVESIYLDIEQGVDLGSKKNVSELMKILNYNTKKSIYALRSSIKSKGWINEDDYGYHYVSALMRDNFDLKYVLKKN